ncbi:MAG: FAD-binding protein [Nitrososphaeria archaeon]|nr:FAD-binding protein [Nitrososphaeria archaeon]NIN52960.1 FAD-binding protein [Nitrososphaeria archaeon]NIQ33519.1 FAD-binding protein [Nitrososphaeria archaeon]
MKDNVTQAISELKKALGEKKVLTEKEDLYPFSISAMGPWTAMPDAVVNTRSTQDVVKVLEIADRLEVPVIPRGGGSSLTGAVIPTKGGIIIDLSAMRKIKVSVEDGIAEAEAGATIAEVDDECQKYGFFLPPDPASLKVASVGGSLSNCSGGMRGARYGSMKEWVLRIETVLPGGKVVWFGEPLYKYRAGYDFVHLFVGSEGTLGVITKAIFKIMPMPEKIVRILAQFDDMEKAGAAIAEVRRRGLNPLILELLDRSTVEAVKTVFDLDIPVNEALIISDVDGTKAAVEDMAKRVVDTFRECGAIEVEMSSDPEEMERLYAARRGAFAAATRLYPMVVIEDITVPLSKLTEAIKRLKNVKEKYNLKMIILGHAGDGNLHPVIGYDPEVEGEEERAFKAFEETCDIGVDLGGAVSGEHGIGLQKVEPLKKELKAHGGEAILDLMREVKKIFDPKGIMNPGKYGL